MTNSESLKEGQGSTPEALDGKNHAQGRARSMPGRESGKNRGIKATVMVRNLYLPDSRLNDCPAWLRITYRGKR